ncbi:endo-1,4-beta-xylanase [Bogoriella caseilytica]|uniref:Beta-xylanase n=1 Tax=Bogoriella caseilytica TaxID=56055 RepID=A0A3N2BEF7_9MICO|nr:endo-1,4-beta-xylanase [Bogoriella caseilytica]ROR73641.1 GH35 family endo-1,4-beta-xylanase [Bogoriella caseilytica]
MSLFTPPAPGRQPDPHLAHRRATASVTVHGPDGAPLADQVVTVRQRSHDFGFGCIGFDLIDHANGVSADPDADAALAEHWLALFNRATLPFYWGRFEPEQGLPHTQELLGAARWFQEHGAEVKGHPLVWHTVSAPWLLQYEPAEIERLQRERIRRDVADFAGVIDTWDAINEVVIMPLHTKVENGITRIARELGRIEMVRLAFEEARSVNPQATLLLNDFDMSSAYECLIEGVLEAGIRIDRLGLQSHMHQGAWGRERTEEILERFSRYNIPIHFTETTILSGDLMPAHIDDLNDWQVEHWPSTPDGEERQADEIEEHYRTLFSHPAVESMTYWGLSDRGMWLGAPGGLLRADGSPKPAYDRLRRLITEEWWLAPTTLRTDTAGQVQFEGFLGTYEILTAAGSVDLHLERPGMYGVSLHPGDG